MSQQEVRVRFAPSPTGHLHIGGVRTALYNWLYAKNQKGTFALRIEDTDQSRSKDVFVDEILQSLTWLGLIWDPPLVYQSQNIAVYKKAAQELVEKGYARKISDDTEAIVCMVDPDREVTFYDIVHGKISFKGKDIENTVIIKSDGFPTYHFACVLDDARMGITHVIRGDDHIVNTPKHILLYEALGYAVPKYAHIPLILGDDGSPLSKRHGAISLVQFIEEGFIPAGLINYLALLGWGVDGSNELFSTAALIEKFSLKKISKTSAMFDRQKLKAINHHHMKQLSDDEYVQGGIEYFLRRGCDVVADKQIQSLFLLYRSRARTYNELYEYTKFYFEGPQYERGVIDGQIPVEIVSRALVIARNIVHTAVEGTSCNEMQAIFRERAKEEGIKLGQLLNPLRYAITGSTVSPDIFELILIVGKEKTIQCVNDLMTFYTQ